jgi:xylulokinase
VKFLTNEYVIGLDLGTTGLKLMMINAQGLVQGTSFEAYPLIQPKLAWAEQDPNDWIRATVDGLRSLLAKCKVPTERIVGIGIASQIDGVVAIDAEANPVGNAIIWMDRRAKLECEKIRRMVADEPFYSSTGLSIDPSHMAPKIMWIQEHRPKVFRKARRLLLPGNFLLYLLTGELYTDHSNASCTMLYDLKSGAWSRQLCDLFNIPVELLPEICDSAHIASAITPRIAHLCGLKRDVRVAVGGGDEEIAAIGAGVLDHGALLDLTGTSEPMCLSLNEPFLDPTRLLECHAHGRNGKWLLENTGGLSGGIYRWFKDEFGSQEATDAARLGVDTYEVLNQEASSVSVGSDGLLFLPFMSGAILPEWNPDARGAFLGLTLGHKRRHFARAIMEGTAYVLKDYVEHARSIGLNPSRIVVGGGGAQGKVWRQIKADVLGCRALSCGNHEVTVLGAAILAAVGVGMYGSVEEAVSRIVSWPEETVPDKSSTESYARFYELYREAYEKLKDSFGKIASLQGQ